MGVRSEIPIQEADFFQTLRQCGAYYECRHDAAGKRLSPLVGYAATYATDTGEKRQYVGEQYLNFAMAEEYPHILDWVAARVGREVQTTVGEVDYVLAPAMGALALGVSLARYLDCRYIFAEKKVVALATATLRRQEVMELARHTVPAGKRVLLAEDVANNFSTTAELIKLVEDRQSMVVGIACGLNRSSRTTFDYNGRGIPVTQALHITMRQYRQDDPEVAADVQAGNLVLKPKESWERLVEAQQE